MLCALCVDATFFSKTPLPGTEDRFLSSLQQYPFAYFQCKREIRDARKSGVQLDVSLR